MAKYRKIPVQKLASGDTLNINVYDIAGRKPGAPRAYLQSAVHGSEVQGSLVLALLLEYLEKHPPLGDIRIVPNANPIGLNNKQAEYTNGRFDPVTGDNFNRQYHAAHRELDWATFVPAARKASAAEAHALFRRELHRSLEARAKRSGTAAPRLAWQLQRLSFDYDLLLDLHCANRAARHCYVPQSAARDAAYFRIPFLLVMPDDRCGGSFDEVSFAPWAEFSKRTGHAHPVQSFTLELGPHEDASYRDAQADLAGILNYLRHKGVIAGKASRFRAHAVPLDRYKVIFADQGGIVDYPVGLGKKVKKGDLLARILTFGKRPLFKEIRAPFVGYTILHHSSAVVHEGAEIVKLVPAK